MNKTVKETCRMTLLSMWLAFQAKAPKPLGGWSDHFFDDDLDFDTLVKVRIFGCMYDALDQVQDIEGMGPITAMFHASNIGFRNYISLYGGGDGRTHRVTH